MSVSLEYVATATVIETLEASVASIESNRRSLTHSAFNTTHSLTASTTPPVTKVSAFEQSLTAGAATIDLTSLTGANGASIDGTGLKVQVLKLNSPTTNSNTISVAPGASNDYQFMGSDFKVTLSPGQEAMLYGNDAAPDIGATDCELDLAGTGTEKLEIVIVMG